SRVRCAIFSARSGILVPDEISNTQLVEPACGRLASALAETIVMTSSLVLVPRGAGRSSMLEHQLRRYHPRFEAALRALAMCHPPIADLAASFPALLFALAVPRAGIDPAPALARVIDGAALADVAAAAGVPMWLRRLPPQTFVRPIRGLPDGELFR